jgi:thiamine biosynthesis lipoprotein
MGTRFDALLFGASELLLAEIWEEIYSIVKHLESILNRFDPSSVISKINESAAFLPQKVDPLIWDILLSAEHYNRLSSGLFDISLGYASDIILDTSTQTVFFQTKDVTLDFGGYAKGFALKVILDKLAAHSISCAFLNFGDSSISTIGMHPHGSNWDVGIANPYNKEQLLESITLQNQSLSVSGNMPSHPVHICNPLDRTLICSKKMTYVVAANPLDAEVLSTVAMIATPVQFESIATKFELDKYKIYNEL